MRPGEEPAEGQELAGRYRLEQRLGRGGMGEVWRALDLRLDRQVAVKVLPVTWSDAQMDWVLARFRREGRSAARLNHPRIATVYDIVAEQGDQPFLVLELLAGPDLATIIERHPGGLPVRQVLEYAAQAAEGLAAAHEAGIIHRDVKPSNLMLDGNGTLKICDFGIAHLEGATAGLTVSGSVLGTCAYMPPEQALGEPLTGAADVYALGATMFHLLTGRLLFPAADLRAVIGQHLYQPPPPPSSLRPTIAQALDSYLLTLLAKDPAARPPARTIPARLRAFITASGRAEVLLADAERLARAITRDPFLQASALAGIGDVASALDPARADELLADAVRRAHGTKMLIMFTEREYLAQARILTLADIARVWARWNPARAEEVIADAERVARTDHFLDDQVGMLTELAAELTRAESRDGEDQPLAAWMLVRATARMDGPATAERAAWMLARATARIDGPAGAERLARAIPDHYTKANALTAIARVLGEQDPARAKALLADAEAQARAIADPHAQAEALAAMAAAMAERDPAGAQRVAGTITDRYKQAEALAAMAAAMAERDPAGAERLARAITIDSQRAKALAAMAAAMAERDPAGAERLARAITIDSQRAKALAAMAAAMAERDPAGAERLARAITIDSQRAKALAAITGAVGERDPARAKVLLADAEILARTIKNPDIRAVALGTLAETMAKKDPDAAERLARTILPAQAGPRDDMARSYQARALANIAAILIEQRAR